MHKKKVDPPFYALATSSISDIPDIHLNKYNTNQYHYEGSEYKSDHSPIQDSLLEKSHREESINFNYSISKPFYEELSPFNFKTEPSFFPKRSVESSSQLHIKKPFNKQLIQYSYSNFVIFSTHINTIVKQLKRNAFNDLKRCQRSQSRLKINHKSSKHSQMSRTTNETYNDNIFYNKINNKKMLQPKEECLQSANLIKRWLEYHVLISYRHSFNLINEYSQKKQFNSNSSLFERSKKDRLLSQKFQLTENNSYQRSNQQIQESLVYTIQNNNDSVRRQVSSFVFDNNPTYKKIQDNQKKRYVMESMVELGNPHSFIFKDKEMLKYYIKQPKLSILQSIVLPKMAKRKEKNPIFTQQVIKIEHFNNQDHGMSIKELNNISLDLFSANKSDYGQQLQSIEQIMQEGSLMLSQSQHQKKKGQYSKYSNSSSVQQNLHYVINLDQQNKEKQEYESQLKSKLKNQYEFHPFYTQKIQDKYSTIQQTPKMNHLIKQKRKNEARRDSKESSQIFQLNNDSYVNDKRLKYSRSQQNMYKYEPVKQSNQKKLDELQHDRIRIYNTERERHNERPIYYTNQNISEHSSIILNHGQNYNTQNMYTSHRTINSKMPVEKIIIHPTIIQPGHIVSQKRSMNKDYIVVRQTTNLRSIINQNKEPCIYYQQANTRNYINSMANQNMVKRNHSKIIQARSLSPNVSFKQESSLYHPQQRSKFSIPQNNMRIINFPQKNNKKPIVKLSGDYVMQNSQANSRPIYHNFPKPINPNIKPKNNLRLRPSNQRNQVIPSNQYQLIQRQKKRTQVQNTLTRPHNVNMHFNQPNEQYNKIYSLSSDQKATQRPALSLQNHFKRAPNYMVHQGYQGHQSHQDNQGFKGYQSHQSHQSHNQSDNFTNYSHKTEFNSAKTQIKRPKSNNKKIQVTLKSK